MLKDGNQGQPRRVSARLDLSKIRHDLRTPINHILGYCEMLQEEEVIPEDFQADLAKIHSGGKHLVALIAEYFDEETFERKQHDLQQLCHELRTPVNHIVGYAELLEEQAEERGLTALFTDLGKIRSAAHSWLELMEEYLVFPQVKATQTALALEPLTVRPVLLQPGIGFSAPVPNNSMGRIGAESRLLVVDDDESNRDMLSRRLAKMGCQVTVASSGIEALRLLRSSPFDLVLLDMVMPGLDGYQVLSRIKSDPVLLDVPVIMISALDQENSVARCIEAGAEDYVPKPFNPVFLRARIAASLEKKQLREKERKTYEALLHSQRHLAAELADAAAYVKSLLPAVLNDTISSKWCFQPSEQLGGDAFGYHWIDSDTLAIYLIDVCGHGVGAALLSVSVLNILSKQGLAEADFKNPASVLSCLNLAYPMERQNNLFFTGWYGVFNRSSRTLHYASGGHPPALLIEENPDTPVARLATGSPAIGCIPESRYTSASCSVPANARLIVLSDGVFEIFGSGESAGTFEQFVCSLESKEVRELTPADRLKLARKLRGAEKLEDDFSLMEFRFA